jgi:heme/copper-type cytochrome/quinol oxidase subunit 2
MPPSRIIFIGASAIIFGIIGLVTVSLLLSNLEAPSGSEAWERHFEIMQEQTSLGLNAMTVSFVFLIIGVIATLFGCHQNARLTEHLARRLQQGDAK